MARRRGTHGPSGAAGLEVDVATDEGQDKGEKWCKRAIWGNTLPSIKKIWKSVDKMTSGAFVDMWRERLAHFYTRYSEAVVGDTNR